MLEGAERRCFAAGACPQEKSAWVAAIDGDEDRLCRWGGPIAAFVPTPMLARGMTLPTIAAGLLDCGMKGSAHAAPRNLPVAPSFQQTVGRSITRMGFAPTYSILWGAAA